MNNTKNNIFGGFRDALKTDLLSGFLVSLIALPLCLGIAGASGFPPIMGVITAIIGGIIVSLFMGSELTIKGPAAGLIVILYGAVEAYTRITNDPVLAWKLTAGLVVVMGLVQIALGLLKTAKIVEFFPLSAVHGMLAAIGIIIMAKQIHLALGIAPKELKGKEPLELLSMLPESLQHMNMQIAVIGILSLIILFGWLYVKNPMLKKIPAALLVLILGIIIGRFEHLQDRTYTSLHPLVEPGEMKFAMNADFNIFQSAYLAVTIKFLIFFVLIGSLESLLSTKAIDLLDPQKRKSNLHKDFYAVGIGNTIAGLFGGLPMISEIARSSANLNNGGRTRWSNFFHGIFLLLFVLVLSSFIKLVPVASLAAMLIFVGFRLAAPKEFIHTYKIGWDQLVVFIGTIIVTLSSDLLIGVFSGILIKIIIQLLLGVPFMNYFKTDYKLVNDSDTHCTYHLNSAGLFTNFLKVSGDFDKIPLACAITLDVSNAKYIDHSFMEKLHEYSKYRILQGGHFNIRGMEILKAHSEHPNAARKQIKQG